MTYIVYNLQNIYKFTYPFGQKITGQYSGLKYHQYTNYLLGIRLLYLLNNTLSIAQRETLIKRTK